MRRAIQPATSGHHVPNSRLQGRRTANKRKGPSTFVYVMFLPAVAFLVIIHNNLLHPPPPQIDNIMAIVPPSPPAIDKLKLKETTVKVHPIPPGDGASLPLAKSLLTKPPPFQDSQIIKLSDQLITSPNTVVTAYFRVPSKFKADNYDGWMKNMLSLQDAMVIFTSADLVPQIKELRRHALNRTAIVPLALDDLPIGTLFSTDFWQDQLDRDPEKKRHKSYQLFWIWLSKSWCTTQAIRFNIFQSDLFMWSDIGCFRDARYNFKTMIQHPNVVPQPQHEMMQMAHHKPNPPAAQFWNDKYAFKPNFYHSGVANGCVCRYLEHVS